MAHTPLSSSLVTRAAARPVLGVSSSQAGMDPRPAPAQTGALRRAAGMAYSGSPQRPAEGALLDPRTHVIDGDLGYARGMVWK